jgi:hypothetical protein
MNYVKVKDFELSHLALAFQYLKYNFIKYSERFWYQIIKNIIIDNYQIMYFLNSSLNNDSLL